MASIKVNQTQLAVNSLQLPQNLLLKINHLLDPPFSLPGGPVVGSPHSSFRSHDLILAVCVAAV
jgi:hypothetical protein